jgi:hypothetical protein
MRSFSILINQPVWTFHVKVLAAATNDFETSDDVANSHFCRRQSSHFSGTAESMAFPENERFKRICEGAYQHRRTLSLERKTAWEASGKTVERIMR